MCLYLHFDVNFKEFFLEKFELGPEPKAETREALLGIPTDPYHPNKRFFCIVHLSNYCRSIMMSVLQGRHLYFAEINLCNRSIAVYRKINVLLNLRNRPYAE